MARTHFSWTTIHGLGLPGTFGGVQGIYQRHDFADEKRAALESGHSIC